MGRKRDRFWDYAEDLKGHFKCNYCKREFPGGASRIKSHLAGVKGRDILICDVVPEDVQKEAYEATQETNKKHKNASTSSKDKEGTLASTSISTIQKEKFVTQRKEEYMAEIVLDDVVDRLVTKAFSLATEHIIFKWGFKEELKNLLDTLYKIKVVLHQKRRVNDESVGIWLMELRNVAYEVDNVLDEFDYEIIWQKVQLQNQMIDQVCSFSFCSHDKVKTIKQSLDKLVNDVAGFGFTTKLLKSIIKIRLDKNEDSFLNDSEVVGREFAVLKILKELISSSNQQVISVLPIVGMAGLGKTTLAKVLYNHEEIKKHFDVLAWVHVSEIFDVEKISREIHESLKIDLTNLGTRKYFLVLDDIWIEDRDKWDILRSSLEDVIHSNGRINIIVTTSSKEIAQIVKTLPPYHLEILSKDDCWSILKKRAFADEGKSLTFDLEASGREIAKRCGGVPLVARVVAGTMCFKCDKNEWLAIQKDKIWYLLDDNNNDIFSALKLCFDHLPTPSLKQCFAYCAIFPKHHDIKKDEVIQYWMAEGFLEPAKEANMLMEDIGNMYFNILLATSFFQNARKDDYGNIISCKMHDLVHDFSLSISKSETLILERDSMDNISNVQHLFVRFDGKITQGTSFSGERFKKLRTLISKNFDFEDMLSNFKFLRVLKLSEDRDSIMELPDSIEQLIHLRLLHISHTQIEELPKSITKLYNLQTLRIEGPGIILEKHLKIWDG
ncbi:putative disease resistance protein RGA3 [Quercus suber]|uniref:putative disease resistance protein RGA3 n=1 Tax=Quercus suber TaxID=58331 RepID=UPI0032DEC59E